MRMSKRLATVFLICGMVFSLLAQVQSPPIQRTIRIYADINVAPASPGAWADLAVPAGNWRIASILAFASTAGGAVTTDVETMFTSNPEFHLRGTETGSVETFISGGTIRATATKKKPNVGAVLVRVIATLQQR